MNEARFRIGDRVQVNENFNKHVLSVVDVKLNTILGTVYHFHTEDGTLVVFPEDTITEYGGGVVLETPKIRIKEFAEDIIAATIGEELHRLGVNRSYELADQVIDVLRARGFRIIREATND